MKIYNKTIPIKYIKFKNKNLNFGRYLSKIIPLLLNNNIKLNINNLNFNIPKKLKNLKLRSYKYIKQYLLKKYTYVINKEILLIKSGIKMLPKTFRFKYITYFNI